MFFEYHISRVITNSEGKRVHVHVLGQEAVLACSSYHILSICISLQICNWHWVQGEFPHHQPKEHNDHPERNGVQRPRWICRTVKSIGCGRGRTDLRPLYWGHGARWGGGARGGTYGHVQEENIKYSNLYGGTYHNIISENFCWTKISPIPGSYSWYFLVFLFFDRQKKRKAMDKPFLWVSVLHTHTHTHLHAHTHSHTHTHIHIHTPNTNTTCFCTCRRSLMRCLGGVTVVPGLTNQQRDGGRSTSPSSQRRWTRRPGWVGHILVNGTPVHCS